MMCMDLVNTNNVHHINIDKSLHMLKYGIDTTPIILGH